MQAGLPPPLGPPNEKPFCPCITTSADKVGSMSRKGQDITAAIEAAFQEVAITLMCRKMYGCSGWPSKIPAAVQVCMRCNGHVATGARNSERFDTSLRSETS